MKRNYFGMIIYCLLVFAILTVSIVALPTNAKYIKQTQKVTNTFSAKDSTPPKIEENFDGQVKENVRIDVGESGYSVYVRAEVVITWKKGTGDNTVIYYELPQENVDYTIVYDLANGWELGKDGYYYYKNPVQSGDKTGILIKECKYAAGVVPPEGYTLSVDIIAQTIQVSAGSNYKEAWNID